MPKRSHDDTVQVNVWLTVAPLLSTAVKVGVHVPLALVEPENAPFEDIETPVGRPVAE